MAQRRMFSKSITNSSEFLMMSQSTQNLYFHFGMNADDDGFCEIFTIMRMTESKPDDLKVLHARGFVNVFDDKVLVILDWKENNYIQKDRYTPSKYLEIYKKELALITGRIQDVYKMETQDRLGKDRLGKDRLEIDTVQNLSDVHLYKSINYLSEIPQEDIKEITSRFIVTEKDIKRKAEDLKLYCESKGKRYKNYKSFLLNAIRRDFKEKADINNKYQKYE